MTPNANPWYAQNAARPYPLDDAATGVDDAGEELPDDVLVDAGVSWAFGTAVPYVSSVSCGPAGTSVTVSTADGVVALATASTTTNKPVRLKTQAGIDAGHVVFGPGALIGPRSWRFSGPAQSRVTARALRAYRPSGLTGIGRPGETDELTGLIDLSPGSDLSVTIATRVVDGQAVRAVVLALAENGESDPYEQYVGLCGRRPESGNCTVKPIEFVRSVPPDCDGDLKLVFRPPFTYVTTPGLIVVGLGFSVEDTCGRGLPDANGNLPGRIGSFPSPPALPPSPPAGPEPEIVPVSSVGFDCLDLPYCGMVGDGLWQDVRGAWADGTSDTRPDCPGTSSSASPGSSSLGGYAVRTGSPTVGRAVSLWYDCAYSTTAGRIVEAAVSAYTADGPSGASVPGRAGVVVGYRPGGGERYVTAEVDATLGALRLSRWNGLGYADLGVSGSFPVSPGVWYVVRVAVDGPPGGPVTLTATAAEDGGPVLGTVVTTLSSWPADDLAGVCCHGAVTNFSYFRME